MDELGELFVYAFSPNESHPLEVAVGEVSDETSIRASRGSVGEASDMSCSAAAGGGSARWGVVLLVVAGAAWRRQSGRASARRGLVSSRDG